MSERANWVDYAKAIGITLVVFGHVESYVSGFQLNGYTEQVHRYVDSFLYTFHMPLFFLLSGLFLESSLAKRSIAGLIAGKVDSLIYPFLLWTLIQGALEVLITQGQVSVGEVLQIWHPRGQLWFLPILFACFVVAALLLSILKMPYFVLAWLTALFFYLQKDTGLPDRFPFELFAGNAIYFISGILFNRISGQFWLYRNYIFVASLVGFVLGQWLFHFHFNLVYATPQRWAAFALAMVSVCFVISGCMLLMPLNLKWLEFVGKRSLDIYLMHYVAATFARGVMVHVFHVESAAFALVAMTFFAVGGPLLAAVLIERFGLSFLLASPARFKLERFLKR